MNLLVTSEPISDRIFFSLKMREVVWKMEIPVSVTLYLQSIQISQTGSSSAPPTLPRRKKRQQVLEVMMPSAPLEM